MANSRLARFVMEVAPPQFVTVMRHRTAKMLDTISEEEKDESLSSSTKTPHLAASAICVYASTCVTAGSRYYYRGVGSPFPVHRTAKMLDTINEEDKDESLSSSTKTPHLSASATSVSASTRVTAGSKYFYRGVGSPFPIFHH